MHIYCIFRNQQQHVGCSIKQRTNTEECLGPCAMQTLQDTSNLFGSQWRWFVNQIHTLYPNYKRLECVYQQQRIQWSPSIVRVRDCAAQFKTRAEWIEKQCHSCAQIKKRGCFLSTQTQSHCICLCRLTVQTTPLMPLNRLAPRLRRSVEGLNLELEEVFVSEKPDDQHEVRPLSNAHGNALTFVCPSSPSRAMMKLRCYNYCLVITTSFLNIPAFGYPRWPQGPCPCPEMQQWLSEWALPRPSGSLSPLSFSVPLSSRSIASITFKFPMSTEPISFVSITVSLSHGTSRLVLSH